MRVIVNADDYGHDENRTRAIQAAFRMGAITATTAMANRPFFEQAMREAREQGFLADVGLHFNLTEGEPLTDEMRSCRMLCNEHGQYTAAFHRQLKTRLYLPDNVRRAIRAEAEAQIVRYLDCGGTLMHLDSHHHVHTDFSVAGPLYAVAQKYGFRSARRSRNFGRRLGLGKNIYKYFWNAYAGRRLSFSTQWFGAFGDFKKSYRSLPSEALVEVMIHPMYGYPGRLDVNGLLTDAGNPIEDEWRFWQQVSAEGVNSVRYGDL